MSMPEEPTTKRAVAFFDGQNLYRHAKDAFGHHHPNYDPIKLTDAVCDDRGWQRSGVRFYTGVPLPTKDVFWSGYWSKRLLAMSRGGILVTSRRLRYRETTIISADGEEISVEVPQEKGIDVKLALDVIRMATNNQLDVAVIFSQDQDLAEVAKEIREIARVQDRWIKIVSAFPSGATATASRGVEGTDWFRMDQEFYNACLYPYDYRPTQSP